MIDKYAGPDGARRLKLLEELVDAVARWSADGHDRRLPGVLDAFNDVVDWDNKRVSRLNQGQVFDEVIKDFKVPLRGLGEDKKT